MPTAVDVLDRINTERRNKFAQEVQPMKEYIGQMQAMKAQQRQRAEGKEDYVWQAEQTTKMAEDRRAKDAQRQGEVAKAYYGGESVENLLSSGKYSAKEIETAMSMGKSPQFASALKDVESGTVGLSTKELMTKYQNLPADQANIIVGAKLDANYNKVYSEVMEAKGEDKQKIIVKAFKDQMLTADQYDKMVESTLSSNKAQADIDLVNAKTAKESGAGNVGSYAKIVSSPQYKDYVMGGMGYAEKKSRAYGALVENGITPDNDEVEAMLATLKLDPPDGLTTAIMSSPEYYISNYITAESTTENKITDESRQIGWENVRKAQIKMTDETPIMELRSQVDRPEHLSALESKRGRSKWDKIMRGYGLNPAIPLSNQIMDSTLLPALLYDLEITEED